MTTLKLEIYDSYVKTIDPTLKQKSIIKTVTSARPKSYFHMARYRTGRWDGYVHLFDSNTKTFPIGLLNTVCMTLNEYEESYELLDKRKDVDLNWDWQLNGFEPRDYQKESVMRALSAQVCTLGMATNAGKTLVTALLVKMTGCKALIIVPRKQLVIQTAEKLTEMLGITVGRYGAGHHELCDVTVTTMASLGKLLQDHLTDLHDNHLVVIDECHRTKASQIFDHIFKIPGRYRIGMSGTPLNKSDLADLKLMGAAGPVVYTISNKDLIEQGVSSNVKVFFKEIAGEDLFSLDYQDAYRTLIVENVIRNKQVVKFALKEKQRGPVLIIVNWIEHAEFLATMCAEMEILTGKDSTTKVSEVLESVVASNGIVVATPIFDEGVDVPAIASVILAAGGKSHIKLLQRIGRGIRVTKDLSDLHIYDFVDTQNKYLLQHSESRYKIVKQEDFSIELI